MEIENIGSKRTITLPNPSYCPGQEYLVQGDAITEINCNKNDRYYVPNSCYAIATTVPKHNKLITWVLKLFGITAESVWKVDVIKKGESDGQRNTF